MKKDDPRGSDTARVTAKRVSPTRPIVVSSKTLGTRITYNLTMQNASRTGLLLVTARNQRVPYHVNTLIELTIDPGSEVLERPAPVLARVVRSADLANGGAHIGVHLIMMEPKDEMSWTKALSSLGMEDDPSEQKRLAVA